MDLGYAQTLIQHDLSQCRASLDVFSGAHQPPGYNENQISREKS